MSRRRIMFLSVLALAVAAFVVDRVFFGEPASASGGPPTPPASAHRASASAPKPAPVAGSRPDPLLEHLENLPELESVRDVFALSGQFLLRQRRREAAARQEAQVEQGRDPVQMFITEHELQTTLVGNDRRMAVVNDRVLQIGDVINGFELVHVDRYRAEFRHQGSGQKASLYLDLLGR